MGSCGLMTGIWRSGVLLDVDALVADVISGAVLACCLAARWATRVDPMIALSCEEASAYGSKNEQPKAH